MKIICRLLFILSSSLFAQTATLDRALGTVTSVDLGGRRIALKTDAGTNVVVSGSPTMSFRRIDPGETDLQKAAMIALADISVDLDAFSLYDAAEKATRSWAMLWWFSGKEPITVRHGEQSWTVSQDAMRKWRSGRK